MVRVVYKPIARGFLRRMENVTEEYAGASEADFEEKEVIIREAGSVTVIPRENVLKVSFNQSISTKE